MEHAEIEGEVRMEYHSQIRYDPATSTCQPDEYVFLFLVFALSALFNLLE